jgi:hypothetical protein
MSQDLLDMTTEFNQQMHQQQEEQVDDWPCCKCGLTAIKRVVKKEGPNIGKPFYTCTKPQDDGSKCNYFQFVDQVSKKRKGMPTAPTVKKMKAEDQSESRHKDTALVLLQERIAALVGTSRVY